jgi:hypothetical protein
MDTIETALHDERMIFCIERLAIKITRIRIGLLPPEKWMLERWHDRLLGRDMAPSTPPEDENNYWAGAIEDGDKFYYRVNGTTVEITKDQFCKVVINPSLYYFSTAMKLHFKIKRAKEGI